MFWWQNEAKSLFVDHGSMSAYDMKRNKHWSSCPVTELKEFLQSLLMDD